MNIQEDDIRAALISQSGNIYTTSDVLQFLQQNNYYKHVGARFLCWMIQLELLSPVRSKWVSELFNLHASYNEIKLKYFSKFPLNQSKTDYETIENSPFFLLTSQISHSILSDIQVTQAWFDKYLDNVGIQSHYKDDARMKFINVVTAINLEYPDLSYTQGNDRLIWISYLVSLAFSSSGGLDRSFAEAMSYYLSRSLISRVKVSRYISDFPHLSRHYHKLDAFLEQEEPELATILENEHHSAIHYAMKWELTLFSDEHKDRVHELMYILDQIIARIDNFSQFFRCLCVAYVRQVGLDLENDRNKDDQRDMIMRLQQKKDWDVARIVDDAVDMMDSDEPQGILTSIKDLILSVFHEHCLF